MTREDWGRLAALTMEGLKLCVALTAATVGWVIGVAPRAGQEGFMDAAVIAAIVFVVMAFGLAGIMGYAVYRIVRG